LCTYQGWQSSNITLLTNGQAYKSNILSYVQGLPRSVGNTDVFYYAGHGDIYGLWVVNETDLSPSDLQTAFGSSYNQYAAFLDACHTGIFPRDMTKGVVSSACNVNELAYEDASLQHTVFGYYLMEGLTNNEAAGSDHLVSAEELFSYAAPRTTNYMSSMHPQSRDNYSGELMLNAVGLSLSGPVRLSVGQQGTWTATPTSGLASYSYAWYFRSSDTGGQWNGPVSTASSYTTRMYDYDGYLDIRADVTGGDQKVSATRHVTCADCSGGPLTPQLGQDSVAIDSASASIAVDVIIGQNYPNPFNPTTQIRFTLLKPNHVTLVVYDMLGREIARLADEQMSAGYHAVTWNASGKASGVYIYRLTAGNTVQVKRMILMK
jgi:Secretion system C-terminal sorting domain